nr:MAG TPA: hypothetical protein [Caudoviricetes sp.]
MWLALRHIVFNFILNVKRASSNFDRLWEIRFEACRFWVCPVKQRGHPNAHLLSDFFCS